MFHPFPSSASAQPLGTCGKCGHWKPIEDGEIGQCRRYPPSPDSIEPQSLYEDTCGEWCPIVCYAVKDEETLRDLIPDEVIEAAPWLLDPVPMDFIRFRMSYKQFWPYAWHLYVFLKELGLYGAAVAAQRSTLYYVDGRAKVSRKPYTPHTNLDRNIKARITWVLDHAGLIFPTMIEDMEVEDPEPIPGEVKINPFRDAPLYERADLFNSRERGALEQLGAKTWGDLDGLTLDWFNGLNNCGIRTSNSIVKKWKERSANASTVR